MEGPPVGKPGPDTVVTSQAAVTKPSLPRRYRLHRYRGAVVTRRYAYIVTSLQLVVTGLTGRRYRSRRYTVVTGCIVTGGRRYTSLHPTNLVVTLPVVTPYTAVVTYLGAAG